MISKLQLNGDSFTTFYATCHFKEINNTGKEIKTEIKITCDRVPGVTLTIYLHTITTRLNPHIF